MATAYITDIRFDQHTLSGHSESAARLQAIRARLDESNLPERLLTLTPEPVTDDQILTVHTTEYLNLLKWSETQRGIQFGPDTYALPVSFGVARLSAGAALRGVDAVLSGEAANALVCARPPGHHAVPDMAMGFCLLANISLAAKHARARYGLQRVMIVDFDVHHGNGTQDIFYSDPDVLFISTHQSPWYPGTGLLGEIGEGEGVGATLNVPLEAGVGDSGFARIYQEIIWPAARRFRPELILVSAGFDAHWADPLGQLQLTLTGYAGLARELIAMADALCSGRIVFVLEGGYNLQSLSHGVLNVAYALLREATIVDPMGRASRPEPGIDRLIGQVQRLHRLDSAPPASSSG